MGLFSPFQPPGLLFPLQPPGLPFLSHPSILPSPSIPQLSLLPPFSPLLYILQFSPLPPFSPLSSSSSSPCNLPPGAQLPLTPSKPSPTLTPPLLPSIRGPLPHPIPEEGEGGGCPVSSSPQSPRSPLTSTRGRARAESGSPLLRRPRGASLYAVPAALIRDVSPD